MFKKEVMKKNNHKITKERRKFPRHKTSLKVALCPSQYLLEKDLLTKDISEDGICLLSPYKIDIGEEIELGIYLPEFKKPIITKGKILRRNETNDIKYPFILGIQFTEIDKEVYQQILKHIRYYFLESKPVSF